MILYIYIYIHFHNNSTSHNNKLREGDDADHSNNKTNSQHINVR